MPIPFRSSEAAGLGTAAFLRVIPFPEGGGYDGALFVMSANGEPVEFCFSRVDTPRTALWRKKDLARRAAAEITRSLVQVCASSPALLLARADEVGPEVFTAELGLEIPVCRIVSSLALAAVASDEREETLNDGELHLFWSSEAASGDEAAHQLVDRLVAADLILEPFERAEAGLREVRNEGAQPS
ncbi:MAG: hypothetical protein ACYCX3_14480 [Thermoleophilia bacterium]